MSARANDAGAAFPRPAVLDSAGDAWDTGDNGMSYRQWLIGRILTGSVAIDTASADVLARRAIALADASIKLQEGRP
jgi:hypothetical protein